MAKKLPGMSPEEQSEAFRKAVSEAVAAGSLDPDEADAAFDRVLGAGAPPRRKAVDPEPDSS